MLLILRLKHADMIYLTVRSNVGPTPRIPALNQKTQESEGNGAASYSTSFTVLRWCSTVDTTFHINTANCHHDNMSRMHTLLTVSSRPVIGSVGRIIPR